MEDDLGAQLRTSPANGFGVTPTFVADGDAEGERAGAEDAAGWCRGCRSPLPWGAQLDLVLKAERLLPSRSMMRAVGEEGVVVGDAFGAEDDGEVGAAGGGGDGLVGVGEEGGVGRRDGVGAVAVAGDEALWETEDVGVGVGCGLDGGNGEGDGVVGAGWEAEVGERDARHGADRIAPETRGVPIRGERLEAVHEDFYEADRGYAGECGDCDRPGGVAGGGDQDGINELCTEL